MTIGDWIIVGYVCLGLIGAIYLVIDYSFPNKESFFSDLDDFLYLVDHRVVTFRVVCMRFHLSDRFISKYGDEIKERLKLHNSGAAMGHLDPEDDKPSSFDCYCDCCYNQDHVCMNPEGICGERKTK